MSLSTSDSRYRNFLWMFLSLSLVTVAVHFALMEWFSRTAYQRLTERKYYELLDRVGEIEVGIIGSSHARAGLRTNRVEVANLGMGGSYPSVMYFKTKFLIKRAQNLRMLVLEADDHLFFSHGIDVDKSRFEMFYDEPIPPELGKHFESREETPWHSMRSDIAPVIHRAGFVYLFGIEDPALGPKARRMKRKAKNAPKSGHKSEWTNLAQEERTRLGIMRSIHFRINYQDEMVDGMKAYYERTVRMATDAGIRVVLVRFPISREYRHAIHAENARKVSRYLQKLSTQADIPLLDLSAEFTNETWNFFNVDHLNSAGAEIVWKKIDELAD